MPLKLRLILTFFMVFTIAITTVNIKKGYASSNKCSVYIDNKFRFNKSISKSRCSSYCKRNKPKKNCKVKFSSSENSKKVCNVYLNNKFRFSKEISSSRCKSYCKRKRPKENCKTKTIADSSSSTSTLANLTDTPPSAAVEITQSASQGCFKTVSTSKYGWLDFADDGKPEKDQVKTGSRQRDRFELSKAPDGSWAVRQNIKKNSVVYPLGGDTDILYDKMAREIKFTYKMYSDNYRTQPGKHFAIMGGRGVAGGHYENGSKQQRINSGEGWTYYLLSPVASGSKGSKNATNGLRGAIGSYNRADLTKNCVKPDGNRGGGDPKYGNKRRCFEATHDNGNVKAVPKNQWVDIGMHIVMNDLGKANGSAAYSVNGKIIDKQNGVQWANNPAKDPRIWIRWRHMFGGNSEKLLPPHDLNEWYKDFKLEVIDSNSRCGS